jgi:hypothetical protein
MVTTTTLSRHYDLLEGDERFVAVIEAMARGDREEEVRLDDACPRKAYQIDDPAYRKRMSISFTAVALACSTIQQDLAVLRTIASMQAVMDTLRGFAGEKAVDAFYAGWYAQAEGKESQELTPELQSDLNELRAAAAEPLELTLHAMKLMVGKKRAVSLLSTWEGLGRFSRECCGLEPLTLAKAWGRLETDPVAEAREVCPDAKVDEAEADGWYGSLTRAWRKHIDHE